MFTMLVIMAIVSTVVTTPALNRWLPRTGFRPPGSDYDLTRAKPQR